LLPGEVLQAQVRQVQKWQAQGAGTVSASSR
jgi:hypothetical protein